MIYSQSTERNILSKSYFLECLRIEKRRVDRSKAPLSIALFSFGQKESNDSKLIQEFLTSIHKSTRETDIIGWIDCNVIGLLLPDTDKRGVQLCVEKIKNDNKSLPYSVSSGTYPDDLFDKLLAEDRDEPDFFPLDLDGSAKSQPFQTALKRIIDVIGSIVGLLLFSPLIFLTAGAVIATSSGPIFFKQSRFGMNGLRFSFYKFRSMYWNMDDSAHRQFVTDLIQGHLNDINQGDEKEPLYKMKSDSRITKVGRIIRKLSIDELPQLFNVLKGEMSLVGPRPPIPYEVEKYEAWHLRRILEVKPGMTGLWQVDGRSQTSFDDMVRLDLRYAENWSLWLDVKILLKTVRAVIRPKGAV